LSNPENSTFSLLSHFSNRGVGFLHSQGWSFLGVEVASLGRLGGTEGSVRPA
jgi:hypothetical protein